MDLLSLGEVEITAIVDVQAEFPFSDVFYEPPPADIATLVEQYPADFSATSWRFTCRCFLVHTPSRVTLVDTGIGPEDSPAGLEIGAGGSLMKALEASGVDAGEVDQVVLTHLHTDHTGWCTERVGDTWRPRFPNATYHIPPADLEYLRSIDDEQRREHVRNVFGTLEDAGVARMSAEDEQVSPGIRLLQAPGHTPGHRCVIVESGELTVMLAGDLLHFSLQLDNTAYSSDSDSDKPLAALSRAAVLNRIEHEKMIFATAHLPVSFATLSRKDGQRILVPR